MPWCSEGLRLWGAPKRLAAGHRDLLVRRLSLRCIYVYIYIQIYTCTNICIPYKCTTCICTLNLYVRSELLTAQVPTRSSHLRVATSGLQNQARHRKDTMGIGITRSEVCCLRTLNQRLELKRGPRTQSLAHRIERLPFYTTPSTNRAQISLNYILLEPFLNQGGVEAGILKSCLNIIINRAEPIRTD